MVTFKVSLGYLISFDGLCGAVWELQKNSWRFVAFYGVLWRLRLFQGFITIFQDFSALFVELYAIFEDSGVFMALSEII